MKTEILNFFYSDPIKNPYEQEYIPECFNCKYCSDKCERKCQKSFKLFNVMDSLIFSWRFGW